MFFKKSEMKEMLWRGGQLNTKTQSIIKFLLQLLFTRI